MNTAQEDTRGQQIYRLAQAAAKLQISPHTLRHWCKDGKISYLRVGSLIMVDQSEISRVIQESRVCPA